MDSLFLLQFACFIFMLVNAFFVALSHLHVRWENKRDDIDVQWHLCCHHWGLLRGYQSSS